MLKLSPALLEGVVAELRPIFLGRALRDVAFVPPADLLLFFERQGDAPAALLISIHARFARLCTATRRYGRSEFASNPFCDRARKLLRGLVLEEFSSRVADRALDLRLGPEAAGEVRGARLHIEFYGTHANAFLCHESEQVIAALEPGRKRARDLRPGRRYAPRAPSALPPAPREEPLPISEGEKRPCCAAVLAELHTPAEQARLETLRSSLARRLERRRHTRLARREGLRERERVAAGAGELRRMGDLLKASLHLVRRGASSVRVPDYYAQPPGEIDIPLDPRLSPAQNADRIYQRSRRLERGLRTVAEEIALVEDELAHLEEALAELAAATDPAHILALEKRALAAALIRPPQQRRAHALRTSASPWREFRSADGLTIRVGRSARDNERLSFTSARGRDLWVHTAEGSGSHVVVSLPRDGDPPEQTLLDAACLALHYSSHPRSAGEVRIARVKDLRRLRGAPPGQVSIARGRTLYLRHDPERLRRLLRGKRAGEPEIGPGKPK